MELYTLTEPIIELWKNIAAINPQVVFKAGTAQRACNASRNFIADIELPSPLPRDCHIYDLPKFLGVIETCKGTDLPSIAFGEKSLVMKHEHGKVTIPYAHPAVIVVPPTAKFHLAEQVASFDLPATMWTKIKRTAAVLQSKTIHLIIKDKTLVLKSINTKDREGASAAYNMPNTEVLTDTYSVWEIKFDALELLPGDYTVTVGHIKSTESANSATMFGLFFKLNDETRIVTYITSGNLVVKDR